MHDHDRHDGRLRSLVAALVGLSLTTLALLWGWNTFATVVLAQPEIRFRDAVALEALLFALMIAPAIAWRLGTAAGSTSRRRRPGP